MKKIKIISFILLWCLVIALLSACNDKTENPSKGMANLDDYPDNIAWDGSEEQGTNYDDPDDVARDLISNLEIRRDGLAEKIGTLTREIDELNSTVLSYEELKDTKKNITEKEITAFKELVLKKEAERISLEADLQIVQDLIAEQQKVLDGPSEEEHPEGVDEENIPEEFKEAMDEMDERKTKEESDFLEE